MKKHYPKVLLFGHSFNNYTGMGITLTNLFKDWPKENIAIWADGIDTELCEQIRPCCIYLGKFCNNNHYSSVCVHKPSLKERIKKIIRYQYCKLGINELRANTKIDLKYVMNAKEFNPDIIFCALGSDIAMKRCSHLMDLMPDSKLVLYIVDDWVNTKIVSRYISTYWRKKYNKDFRYILNRSSGLLSICQYMSENYKKQYGKTFYPFHNPVDIEYWKSISAKSIYPKNIISILYMGKINADTTSCLLDMCKTIENLKLNGIEYIFDIYTPDYSLKAYLFTHRKNIHIFPPIAHDNVPNVMKSYSSLFLPLGFSIQSRTYVRLSMPTKLTEYLASGKPMIVYCPEEIALAKYLKDKDCAIMCTKEGPEGLYNAVLKLRDKTIYNRLVENALDLATKHDVHSIRESFRNTLNQFLH